MPAEQDDVFRASEGDRWFARNKAALDAFDPAKDLPTKLVEMYGLKPASVLEVGAANGVRLESLRRRLGARAAGADASAEAVADGRARFPQVDLRTALAASLPFTDPFGLVIVNFVFHWVDRSSLFRSAAEVDRLVSDGGFLVIGDFLPENRWKVRYHHLPEKNVHTFKQDYAALFLASGLYHPVALLTRGHAAAGLSSGEGEQERMGVWLLEKKLDAHYADHERNT